MDCLASHSLARNQRMAFNPMLPRPKQPPRGGSMRTVPHAATLTSASGGWALGWGDTRVRRKPRWRPAVDHLSRTPVTSSAHGQVRHATWAILVGCQVRGLMRRLNSQQAVSVWLNAAVGGGRRHCSVRHVRDAKGDRQSFHVWTVSQ